MLVFIKKKNYFSGTYPYIVIALMLECYYVHHEVTVPLTFFFSSKKSTIIFTITYKKGKD